MKYLLVSDIHGSLPALERVLHVFEQEHCDLLCLLGDILNYGPRNGLPEGLDPQGIVQRLKPYADRIVAVRGNCDSEVDQMLLPFPIMSDYALLVDEGKRLFLTIVVDSAEAIVNVAGGEYETVLLAMGNDFLEYVFLSHACISCLGCLKSCEGCAAARGAVGGLVNRAFCVGSRSRNRSQNRWRSSCRRR